MAQRTSDVPDVELPPNWEWTGGVVIDAVREDLSAQMCLTYFSRTHTWIAYFTPGDAFDVENVPAFLTHTEAIHALYNRYQRKLLTEARRIWV